MASPWIVDPIRKDDCALVSDGGAALVVMSAKRAKELGVAQPVPVLGFGHGQTSYEIPQRATLTSTEAARAADTAFRMAGVKPADVDVAQLYDCFTVTVLMTLEDYGFCRKGEAGRFVADGAIEIGGALAGQHQRRPAVRNRHAGHAADHGGRAADARHRAPASARREGVPGEQPGRHHAHARHAAAGELT